MAIIGGLSKIPIMLPTAKTIIITGASGNLGKIVTGVFLGLHYRVIAVIHNEAGKKELPSNNLLQVEVANLSNEKETIELVSRISSEYGHIHAAILLAGGFTAGNIADQSIDDIRKMVILNFETAYNVVRGVLPHMVKHGSGRMILMGARAGIQPAEGRKMVAYGLSKSLLFTLAEYINEETRGKNINATVIVPSTIDTIPNRESMPSADYSKWVQPKELADIMHFILSSEAGSIREAVIKVYNNS